MSNEAQKISPFNGGFCHAWQHGTFSVAPRLWNLKLVLDALALSRLDRHMHVYIEYSLPLFSHHRFLPSAHFRSRRTAVGDSMAPAYLPVEGMTTTGSIHQKSYKGRYATTS